MLSSKLKYENEIAELQEKLKETEMDQLLEKTRLRLISLTCIGYMQSTCGYVCIVLNYEWVVGVVLLILHCLTRYDTEYKAIVEKICEETQLLQEMCLAISTYLEKQKVTY